MTVVMMSSCYGSSNNNSNSSDISDISEILQRIVLLPSSKHDSSEESKQQQYNDDDYDRLHNSYNSSHQQFKISFCSDKISLCNDNLDKSQIKLSDSRNNNLVYYELKYEICTLKEKVLLLEHQLKSSNEQHQIQVSQYKERITIQDERIKNQQQQLSLLYKAASDEKTNHIEKQYQQQPLIVDNHLLSINEDVTKQQVQIAHEEAISCGIQKPSFMMTMSNNMMSDWQDTTTANRGINCKKISKNDFIIRTTTPKEEENPTIKSTNNIMPSGNNNIVVEEVLKQQQVPQKQQQQKQVMMHSNDDCIISGMLNIRSINAYGVRKWVPHNVQMIAHDDSYYELEVTIESKNKKIKKKYYSLHQNISKIEHDTKHNNAFILHINCIDKTAPVLYFSTDTKETYDRWLSTLSLVTTNTITTKTNTSLTRNSSSSSSGTTPFLTGVIGGGPMMIERSDSRSVKRSIPSSYHPPSLSTTTNKKCVEQSLLVLTPEEQEVIDLALAIEASNNDIAILHSNVNDFLDTLEDE